MKLIDISWPITDKMTEYKDKKTVKLEKIKTFEKDGVRESVLQCGAHTGTHIDAPAHFLKNGTTVDKIPLDTFMGLCQVLDLTEVEDGITADDLAECEIEAGDIILFKTANSSLEPTDPFQPDFVYLTADGAEYLVDLGVKAVGIDYLGIERNQPDHATHTILLENEVAIIEGLRLDHVQAGVYYLCCFPMAMQGVEAAPARAILMED